MDKEIKEKENELNKLDIDIHISLNDIIDKIYFISSIAIELNKFTLKKNEDTKFGYCKELFHEKVDREEEIEKVFCQTLDNIESISSSREQKVKYINKIINILN